MHNPTFVLSYIQIAAVFLVGFAAGILFCVVMELSSEK